MSSRDQEAMQKLRSAMFDRNSGVSVTPTSSTSPDSPGSAGRDLVGGIQDRQVRPRGSMASMRSDAQNSARSPANATRRGESHSENVEAEAGGTFDSNVKGEVSNEIRADEEVDKATNGDGMASGVRSSQHIGVPLIP